MLGPAAASTFGVFTADLCLLELGVPCTRARLDGVSITVACILLVMARNKQLVPEQPPHQQFMGRCMVGKSKLTAR